MNISIQEPAAEQERRGEQRGRQAERKCRNCFYGPMLLVGLSVEAEGIRVTSSHREQ